MISSASDYKIVTPPDGIVINGDILPARDGTGSARVLRGEDACFLAEAAMRLRRYHTGGSSTVTCDRVPKASLFKSIIPYLHYSWNGHVWPKSMTEKSSASSGSGCKYVLDAASRGAGDLALVNGCLDTESQSVPASWAADASDTDAVAAGMMKWAKENGVTHYTHWFQPLTEGTAEKHDSFIEHDGKGGMIEEFSGKLLAQQEADGSSFPNGGIRNTFEARGYTAWDTSSPAFIVDDTLCIPTVFVSYTGEALDYKTPLLKALHAVDCAATAVCQLFDPAVSKVYSYLGWEQEYFLVDESIYSARPDLLLTGRTLLGHESAKNQQLEDHYFGAIPARVQSFMKELEFEAYKYAIPCKTRHNEVV